MSEGAYTISVSTAGLGVDECRRVEGQITSEGIPFTTAGDSIVVDHAFEARVEGLVAEARASMPTPSGFATTAPLPPPGPPLGYAPAPAYGQAPGYPPAYTAPYSFQPRVTNSNATMSLVLGIVGWVVCPIAAIFGITYGRRAEDEIAASGGTQSGEGLAKAGIIISWVVLGIWGVTLVGMLLFFIIFGAIAAVA